MAYVRPVSKTTWYLQDRNYTVHIINELTSVFVGILALILLWGIGAVAGGPEAYQSFLDGLRSPGTRLLLWITTIIVFYHAFAWFKVTPKAMPLQKGEEFVSGGLIAGAHSAVWAVVSLIVLFLAGCSEIAMPRFHAHGIPCRHARERFERHHARRAQPIERRGYCRSFPVR